VAPAAHPRNRVRGPLNAAGLAALDGVFDRTLGDIKQRLLADHPPALVEFGTGPGTNFRYLRPGTRVVAIEPNPAMHRRLVDAGHHHNIDVELLACGAGDVPLPDASVDAIVCTLVLCTVPDPAAAIAEAVRLLRPGGELLFIEHVAAPSGPASALGRTQRLVRRPWRWLFEGCDVCRPTGELLDDAGFSHVEIHHRTLRPPVVPIAPLIWGRAVR
jgi:SAM-dependent methyltransferase